MEVVSRFPLASQAPSLPTEGMASVKVRAMERLFLNGSIGTGLTRGVGAASSRAYFGITSAPGKEPLAIDDAEAIAYKDIRVADHRSLPLRAARVTVGSTTVHTDDEGYALLPSRAVDRQGLLTISCDGFETVELAVAPAPRCQLRGERLLHQPRRRRRRGT